MKHLNKFNETFKFREVAKPHSDELYLLLNFAGGDADTEHPVWVKFSKDVKFSNYQNHMFELDRIIDEYKMLKEALDINSRNYCKNYEQVKQKFGRDIADLYDNAPNDPQSDYSTKCYLSSMELVGYDAAGAEHRAYIK
jgi:hypothetical protein